MIPVRGNSFVVVFFVSTTIAIVGQRSAWPPALPDELLHLDIAARILTDPEATSRCATDFGRLTYRAPVAVLHPVSELDIAALVRLSYASVGRQFAIAARGNGHSIRGQAAAADGVVIEMRALGGMDGRIRVAAHDGVPYVDAGGEQLWADVLRETLRHGMAPRSWTDYLHLTVGGTLSVGGVSGQAFRHGPQISNVYQLDVINGKGEMVTCSKDHNEDLFHAVLGGLGQFGVITRAWIALEPAPERARWVRLMYTDFTRFTRDQEYLISLDGSKKGFHYVEGSLFLGQSPINSWRCSFFSESDLRRIGALARLDPHGTIYCLEATVYYDHDTESKMNKEVEALLRELNFVPGFVFMNDIPYASFLDRVHEGETRLRAKGLWEVPHPWLNIFVPRSRIRDFDQGVFKGILKHQKPMGPILIYPLNRTKWDERMSIVIPEEEEVFYSVGLLRSAIGDSENLDNQNRDILGFCEQQGIKFKQYMPHYTTRPEWMKHFGDKWNLFLDRKRRYDPKCILSTGQGIFSSPIMTNRLSSDG